MQLSQREYEVAQREKAAREYGGKLSGLQEREAELRRRHQLLDQAQQELVSKAREVAEQREALQVEWATQSQLANRQARAVLVLC